MEMKTALIIVFLIATVLLCDKYEDRLPPPLKWIYAAWKKFAELLGIVMSFIILTILWIVGFGTYAVILKIITVPRRFKAEPDSYWIEAHSSTVESMKHQF